LAYVIGSSKVIKVGGEQKPYEMWQAGNSLAASPLANFLAGGGSAARSPAHESRQLRRLWKYIQIVKESCASRISFPFQLCGRHSVRILQSDCTSTNEIIFLLDV